MIRIGLLGASRIARGAMIEPAAVLDEVAIVAVAARDRSRAQSYAREHAIPGVFETYSALIASPDVDLVYVGLPPSEHCEWTVAALRAGKHVICEKPFAMSSAEAIQMVATAAETGCVLIEAYHYRFHPAFQKLLGIVQSGKLGDVLSIRGHFNVPIRFSDSEIRYIRQLGGGSTMDLGCYPLHWSRTLVGEEPAVVSSSMNWHSSGVDLAMTAELEFPNQVEALVSCSMSERLPDSLDTELVVTGSHGTVTMRNPLAPHLGHELVLSVGDKTETSAVDGNTTYWHQLCHAIAVIDGRASPITGGEDAVATMRLIESVYEIANHSMEPSAL